MPEFVGRLRTPRLASAPSSPATGEMYYDTGQNKLYWWNGTAWLPASGADVVYNGAHPAGSPYTPGDVVVSNGVAYMAVRATAAAPTPWPQVPPYPDTTGKTNNILTVPSSGAPPVWSPPAPQGADLVYNGPFPANTPYTDGDIVIQNGIAYMCVRPTSAAPVAWPSSPIAAESYGTTLPTAPFDGQKATLVDSLTAPNYVWRFRYNAGSSSAYKWEFIGGSPWTVYLAASGALLTGWNSSQPSLIVPRNGVYIPEAEALFTGTNGLVGIAAWITGQINTAHQTTSGSYWSLHTAKGTATLTAGQTLMQGVYTSTGSGSTFTQDRYLILTPVRVA